MARRSSTGWWVCQSCHENPVKDEGDPPYRCAECRDSTSSVDLDAEDNREALYDRGAYDDVIDQAL